MRLPYAIGGCIVTAVAVVSIGSYFLNQNDIPTKNSNRPVIMRPVQRDAYIVDRGCDGVYDYIEIPSLEGPGVGARIFTLPEPAEEHKAISQARDRVSSFGIDPNSLYFTLRCEEIPEPKKEEKTKGLGQLFV